MGTHSTRQGKAGLKKRDADGKRQKKGKAGLKKRDTDGKRRKKGKSWT